MGSVFSLMASKSHQCFDDEYDSTFDYLKPTPCDHYKIESQHAASWGSQQYAFSTMLKHNAQNVM